MRQVLLTKRAVQRGPRITSTSCLANHFLSLFSDSNSYISLKKQRVMRFDGLWRNKLKTKQANRQTKSPKTQTQKSSSIHW